MNISVARKIIFSDPVCTKSSSLPCFWRVVQCFLLVCGVFLYCFVGFVIYKLFLKYRTPYYAFTLSLALCNIIVIFINVFQTLVTCIEGRTSLTFCIFLKLFEVSSCIHMVAISLSRVVAVVYIYECPIWLRNYSLSLIVMWSLAIIFVLYRSVSLYRDDPDTGISQYVEFTIMLTCVVAIVMLTCATAVNLCVNKTVLEQTQSRKMSAYKRQIRLFVRCFIQCSFLFYTVIADLWMTQRKTVLNFKDDWEYRLLQIGRHMTYTAFFICPPILCLSFDNLVQHAVSTQSVRLKRESLTSHTWLSYMISLSVFS